MITAVFFDLGDTLWHLPNFPPAEVVRGGLSPTPCLVSRTLSGATHDWQNQTYGGFAVNHTVTFENVDTPNWGNIALYCQVPGADGARIGLIRIES